MEDVCHNALENTGNAELIVESRETEPWDSIGISSKNIILSASQCSEENVLKYTFKACDPEQTGEVSVFRIIEYLQEMTGQSCEDWRFQSLYTRLDPEERGISVDFPTFHQVMKDWIADCQKDGEEAADVMTSIKDLQQGNKQLAMLNIKLQRTIETAEELNSRLSEEIAELKGKLRGTQQALEQARAVANELEDLKFFSKTLEKENSNLHTQCRLVEKEQQCLLIQVDNQQEENRKLLLEKESCRNKIKQLSKENAKMKSQLFECENLISCKDMDLTKKEKQTEELTVTLDEYQMMVQELKREVRGLQEQLCNSCEDREGLQRNSLENTNTCCIQVPAQSLSVEIEESQKDEHTSLPEITEVSSAELYEPAPEEQALVPVHHELVPAGGKKLSNKWFPSLKEWFLDVPLRYLLLLILLLGLILVCVLLLIVVCLVPPYGCHLVWTEPRGMPWYHLHFQHLQPPPV